MIAGRVTLRENGKISLAGPLSNFILAIMFLGLTFYGNAIAGTIGILGFQINSWLGLFNLIPFGNFDGRKILDWHRYIWLGMVLSGLFLLFVLPKFIT